jgi:hypothetical protein
MADLALHGLIQKARKDAEALPYKFMPGGNGVRLWRRWTSGWGLIGELQSAEDAEDFLVGKLTQEDR